VGCQYPILHQLTMVPRVAETMGSCLGCLPPDTDANEATCEEGRKGEKIKIWKSPNQTTLGPCCAAIAATVTDRGESIPAQPCYPLLTPNWPLPPPRPSTPHPYSYHIGTVPISALDHEIPILYSSPVFVPPARLMVPVTYFILYIEHEHEHCIIQVGDLHLYNTVFE